MKVGIRSCILSWIESFNKKMSLKTYGDRPISFQLEENGEFYCVGSEVCLLTILKLQSYT